MKTQIITPYRVGQVVVLKDGHRGKIVKVFAAKMPATHPCYYRFAADTGAEYTIGHHEIEAASPDAIAIAFDQAYRRGIVDGRNGRPDVSIWDRNVPELLREYVRGYNESARIHRWAPIQSRSLAPAPGGETECKGAHS